MQRGLKGLHGYRWKRVHIGRLNAKRIESISTLAFSKMGDYCLNAKRIERRTQSRAEALSMYRVSMQRGLKVIGSPGFVAPGDLSLNAKRIESYLL